MKRQRRLVALALTSVMVSLLLAASPAMAASQTQSTNLTLSGSASPSINYRVTGVCDACVPDAAAQLFTGDPGSFGFGATVDTTVSHIDWTNTAGVAVNYDDALLRQGQTLPLSNVLTTNVGHVHATGSIGGSYGLFNDPSGGSSFVPYSSQKSIARTAAWDFSCTIPLPGESPRACSSGSQSFDIDSYTLFVAPFVDPISFNVDFKVAISLDLSVSSDGVISVRQIEVSGGNGPQAAPLSWAGSSPSTTADAPHFSCADPAGNPVTYTFTGNASSPTNSLASTTALVAKVVASPAVGPDVTLFSLGTIASVTTPPTDVSFAMSAPDASVTLGTLAKNNVPPVVNPGGGASNLYAGVEGSPVTFDGSGSSSVCGFPTLRWDFSDGGVAFGARPQHTFQGPGLYSGLVTATDPTGLSSSSTFSVDVANLPPMVAAGPDTTVAWGRPVAFAGAATDPGADDQATLTYAWDFGDGSPSASGGPSTLHAYATPADYTARLTSCDRGGACASSTRVVHIVKRAVSVGYVGDTSGTFATGGALSASLVDQFGAAVNGRTVTFTVSSAAAGSAVTNSSGVASTAYTPMLAVGSYATGAAFAGDSLYQPNTGAGSITIARKATAVAYTGALSGGPNKVVNLSAVLTDATGISLGGRTIVFQLGTQTASATTGPTGVASTSLKLTQKNGKYPLTATWTPSGADAGDYVGSGSSVTFTLQAK